MRGIKQRAPLPMIVVRTANPSMFDLYFCTDCGWIADAPDGSEKNYICTEPGDPVGPMCWDCSIRSLGGPG